ANASYITGSQVGRTAKVDGRPRVPCGRSQTPARRQGEASAGQSSAGGAPAGQTSTDQSSQARSDAYREDISDSATRPQQTAPQAGTAELGRLGDQGRCTSGELCHYFDQLLGLDRLGNVHLETGFFGSRSVL